MALSSFKVKKMTQIASAFAAYSGGILLEKRKSGIDCFGHQHKLKTLLSLIDAIQEYGTIYSNSYFYFGITSLGYGSSFKLTVNGNIFYDNFVFTTSIPSIANQQLVDFINESNHGFSAEITGAAGGTAIKISSNNGSLSVGNTASVSTTGAIGVGINEDLIVNGNFDTNIVGWTNPYSEFSWVLGTAKGVNVGTADSFYQTISGLVIGQSYTFQWDVVDYVSGDAAGLVDFSLAITPCAANGTYQLVFVATATSHSFGFGCTSFTADYSVDNVSLVGPSPAANFTFIGDGEDFFSRNTDRCLEDNEVESILDRIDGYIDCSYSKFVSF